MPSQWGADVFISSGIAPSKVFVVPEAIDVSRFDPDITPRNRSLLPDSEGHFAFLSIGKWEERKGWSVLIKAFTMAFNTSDPVTLYIRSGDPLDGKVWNYRQIWTHGERRELTGIRKRQQEENEKEKENERGE